MQVFGIRADLLKQCSLRFDVVQLLLTLIFFLALLPQAVGAPDASQGAVTEREIEFANQTVGPEGGKFPAQRDDLPFDLGQSLACLAIRSPAAFGQTRWAVPLKAPQPFADRGQGGAEQTRARFDAAPLRALQQSQAMVVGVLHFTNQVELASRTVMPTRLSARHAAGLFVPRRAPSSLHRFGLMQFNHAKGGTT